MKKKRAFISKAATTLILLTIISMIIMVFCLINLGGSLLSNPESIGEWFGKLAEGFKGD